MSKNIKQFNCHICGSTVRGTVSTCKSLCSEGCREFKVVPKKNLYKYLFKNDKNNFYCRLYNKLFQTFSILATTEIELENQQKVDIMLKNNSHLKPPMKPPVQVPIDLHESTELYKWARHLLNDLCDQVVDIVETDKEEISHSLDTQPDNEKLPPAPVLEHGKKQKLFKSIVDKVELTDPLPSNNSGDKNNAIERAKSVQDTCNDGVNDMIRILKSEQGKLHEVVRIKTQECDKLMQYVSGLERTIMNMKEGRFQKIHEFVYNQSDHIRVAQISQNVLELQKTTSTLTELMYKMIKQFDNLKSGQPIIQGDQDTNNEAVDNHAASSDDIGILQGGQQL